MYMHMFTEQVLKIMKPTVLIEYGQLIALLEYINKQLIAAKSVNCSARCATSMENRWNIGNLVAMASFDNSVQKQSSWHGRDQNQILAGTASLNRSTLR